jgi:hypothetical protein
LCAQYDVSHENHTVAICDQRSSNGTFVYRKSAVQRLSDSPLFVKQYVNGQMVRKLIDNATEVDDLTTLGAVASWPVPGANSYCINFINCNDVVVNISVRF